MSGIAGLAGWSLLSGEKLDMQETRQRMTGTSLSCCKCILLVKTEVAVLPVKIRNHHNPLEWSEFSDCVQAANILKKFVIKQMEFQFL